MRQFVAILKDSFREAVDGFVIYAMLALSAVVIVVLGSLSFTPTEPGEAFAVIARTFDDAVFEGGRVRGILGQYATFEAQDVRPEGAGYKLRLVATGQKRSGPVFGPPGMARVQANDKKADEPQPDGKKAGEKKPDEAGTDGFRELVARWERDGKKWTADKVFGGEPVTPAERRAVTDAQMVDFVRSQFAFHAGMDVTAVRVGGVAEPEYRFDVTTAGGSAVRGWPHKLSLFFGAWTLPVTFNLGETLFWLQDRLVNGVGAALALLISIVITAFFIPNMIRKGSVDLLISKPIGRSQLLVYKYVGGLTFIFLVTAVTVGGVWLALAVRSGIWDPTFLIVIPVLTFTFAILYAVSTLAAVVTRSPIVSILLAVGFAVFLYIVGNVKTVFDTLRENERVAQELPKWSFTLVDTVNNVLPRYKDLDKLTTKLLSSGTLTPAELRERALDVLAYPSWGETIGVSLAFIALMLALACWRFSRRDY
jgi:ABC-type transport system involved in multi-copper enzyme maturation permease subunit